MLTKTDLDHIRKVVRQEVKVEVTDATRTLDSQIRLSRMRVQASIGELDDRVKNVEIKLSDVGDQVEETRKDVVDVKKRVGKIEETVDLIAKNYDEGDVILARRVKKIEEHVGLPTQN